VAGNITTQPKQGRRAVPMSSLSILLCLWVRCRETSQCWHVEEIILELIFGLVV